MPSQKSRSGICSTATTSQIMKLTDYWLTGPHRGMIRFWRYVSKQICCMYSDVKSDQASHSEQWPGCEALCDTEQSCICQSPITEEYYNIKFTLRVPASIRALIGAMPDPVAKMKTSGAASGPILSMRKPGPSTGLASTSVPERNVQTLIRKPNLK